MKLKLLIIVLLIAAGIPMAAQINIPNATPVTQNFDGMGSSATATIPGNIKVNTAANYTGGTTATTAAAGTSGAGVLTGSIGGGAYNFANGVTASSTDRALGFLSSGSYSSPRYINAAIRNTGTDVISQVVIAFDYEKYRSGSREFDMTFFHGPTATNINTAATDGDHNFPADANNNVVFDPPTAIAKSVTITDLSILPGETYYLSWKYTGNGGATNAQAIGIDNLSITATFSPICTTPTVQPSAITVSSPTQVGADISWTNAVGTYGTILVIRPTSAASVPPVSGTNYVGNTNYATAQQINANNRVIYKGPGNSVTGITGLAAGTQYTATIYSYNEPGRCYNTTTPESINFFTLTAEPTFTPSSFSCLTISGSQINLSFQAFGSNANGYVITYREGAAPTGLPVDGVQYSPGSIIGDATVLTEITSSTATTFSAMGLNAGSVYHFALFPFNGTVGNGITYNYKTTSPRTTGGCSTTTAPEINVKGDVNPTYPNILNNDFVTTPLDNTYAGTAAVGGSIIKTFRIQNIGNSNLTVSSIGKSGAHPGDFTVSGVTFPLVITGGNFVVFTVTFSPTAGGLRSAIIQIASNDSDEGLYQFAVEGTGNAAEIDVLGGGVSIPSGSVTVSTTNMTQYGDVNYPAGSLAHTFTISNLGTLGLTISSFGISGPNASDFTITTSPSSSIAAGTATTMVITFDPATPGIKNATVTIVNSDTDEGSYTFAIQGTGTNYIFCAPGAVEVIASQNFEPTPLTPTLTYTFTQELGMSVPSVTGGNLLGANRSTMTPAYINTRSFQVKGYSTSSSAAELSATIDFDTYDVSAYTEVSLDFKLGAYSSTIGTDVGLDVDDEVYVYISTNGGASWSHEMTIEGRGNSIWDINSGTQSAIIDADGDNIPTLFTPPGVNSVNQGPRNITINNIPNATQLKVRIVMKVNRTDEIWVIDNVTLSGRKPSTTTWNGSAWSNLAPTNTKRAIFTGNYSIATSVEACACEIKPSVIVNIPANRYFEIQNTIDNSGTINIANNGSLIQVNDYAVNGGVSNVIRSTTPYDQYDYTYWSSPVFEPEIGTTFPDMRTDHSYSWITSNFVDANGDGFDDAAPWAWHLEGPTAVMKQGVGYIVRASSTAGSWPHTSHATFSGVLNNGIVSVPTSMSPNPADSNSLVGNPYASAISADDFIDLNTNIDGTLYFWTHVDNVSPSHPGPYLSNFSSDDYAVYTKMGGTGTRGAILHPTHPVSGKTTAPTGKIASGQGFYVTMLTPTPIVFNNGLRSKSHANTDFYKTTGSPEEKDRVWLNLYNEDKMFSQQLVGYTEEATLGKDRGYDGPLSNAGNYINFYSLIGNERFKIQGRSAFDISDEVPLGYFSAVDDVFKIEIDSVEGQLRNISHIYLHDRELQIFHDLKQGSYSFTTQKGTFNDRFVIRYTNGTLDNTTFEATANDVVVAANDKIEVKSLKGNIQKIQVFDVLGRLIYTNQKINQREFLIENIAKTQSALIVKVTLDNQTESTKKIRF